MRGAAVKHPDRTKNSWTELDMDRYELHSMFCGANFVKETQVPDISWEFAFVNRTNVTLVDSELTMDGENAIKRTREVSPECLESEEDEYRI